MISKATESIPLSMYTYKQALPQIMTTKKVNIYLLFPALSKNIHNKIRKSIVIRRDQQHFMQYSVQYYLEFSCSENYYRLVAYRNV